MVCCARFSPHLYRQKNNSRHGIPLLKKTRLLQEDWPKKITELSKKTKFTCLTRLRKQHPGLTCCWPLDAASSARFCES